tara:strand:- start:2338 stop:3270 length:933 start_codon:yes stop_codon:yes gene_type:complete
MRIIRYVHKNAINIGLIINKTNVINIKDLKIKIDNMIDFLDFLNNKNFQPQKKYNEKKLIKLSQVKLLSPLRRPNSLRDAYAFRKHVEAGRKGRGLPMIKEFDLFPVYYYSNHSAIYGPGNISFHKDHFDRLDFELELAIVIAKEGRNIKIENADDYIFGFMIMNDWSARSIQKSEMKLNLGPAKGKDFATSLGPYIITKDKLKNNTVSTENGNQYNLKMEAFINNQKVSEDNSGNMNWTFAQIISHISKGATLYPGDVIGSGTCATGCLLEINLTNKTDNWLKLNDVVKLKIEHLGSLENKIKLEKIDE